jgi:hypothetical protein
MASGLYQLKIGPKNIGLWDGTRLEANTLGTSPDFATTDPRVAAALQYLPPLAPPGIPPAPGLEITAAPGISPPLPFLASVVVKISDIVGSSNVTISVQ